MTETNDSVKVTLRIPGDWAHPGELLERMPDGFRLTPDALILPGGAEIEFNPMQPDDEFAQIFETSCRQPATDDELATVNRYSVNVGLTGPGGSMDAAQTMMQAGAAIVQAGGAGVFIDNCGLAHGGGHWLEMTDDGSPDAVSFAFATIVGGESEVWTMGMHVMGFPDITMRRADIDEEGEMLVEVIRYISSGIDPIADGHLLGDENGPSFQAQATSSDERMAGSPMYNPYGRLKLTSLKDVAEGN